MAQTIIPNEFQLDGPGIHVDYSTSDLAGKPRLTLRQGRKTLSFAGDDIQALHTSIGALISVRVSAKPDQTFTSFDLLLPEIRLAKPTAKQKFQAIGITTVHKTTIAGPGTGVEQTYKTVALRGTAQLVVTLAPKTAQARAN